MRFIAAVSTLLSTVLCLRTSEEVLPRHYVSVTSSTELPGTQDLPLTIKGMENIALYYLHSFIDVDYARQLKVLFNHKIMIMNIS